MKGFLRKVAAIMVMMMAARVASFVTGDAPAWYLLTMWLWKDLSETMRRRTECDVQFSEIVFSYAGGRSGNVPGGDQVARGADRGLFHLRKS